MASFAGCTAVDDKQGASKEQPEKPKPAFELGTLTNQPAPGRPRPRIDNPKGPAIKPGHQMSLTAPVRSNYDDFRGTLHWELRDAGGRPAVLPDDPRPLESVRPVILPKGQLRSLELPVFFPSSSATRMAIDLPGAAGGSVVVPLRLMPAQQYQFLVLVSDPSDYQYLGKLDAIKFPGDALDNPERGAHYDLIVPGKEGASLPRGLLHWTAVAFVLWDEYDGEKLDADERASLLDWLHWGGQLVVSGPGTLESLQDSFLNPYLPATTDTTVALAATDLEAFNEFPWDRQDGKLTPVKPWSGVRLTPHPESQVLIDSPQTPLVVERRVGRGRIVLTAFRLSQREFVQWDLGRGCDRLWHSALLRRAPRKYVVDRDNDLATVNWAQSGKDFEATTDLRLFARDAGKPIAATFPPRISPQPFPVPLPDVETIDATAVPGAWSDHNRVAQAARQILVEAAGLVVPERSFVVRILAVYLLLLAPANWLLFRLVNRVEWAWFVVPVLAVIFTGLVTWLAQVNVGFARTRTEINVIELQANHPRVHVARYSALYSSLGTAYEVRCMGSDSLALPFTVSTPATVVTPLRFESTSMRDGQRVIPQTRLTGFVVASNATGMLHLEYTHELGAIECRRRENITLEVVNHTPLGITGWIVGDEGSQWLGTLGAGGSAIVSLTPNGPADLGSAADISPRVAGIDLAPLVAVARDDRQPRELRLVGWCQGEIGGATIAPEASQVRTATLIVAHLDFGKLPAIEPDVNAAPKRGDDDGRDRVSDDEK